MPSASQAQALAFPVPALSGNSYQALRQYYEQPPCSSNGAFWVSDLINFSDHGRKWSLHRAVILAVLFTL